MSNFDLTKHLPKISEIDWSKDSKLALGGGLLALGALAIKSFMGEQPTLQEQKQAAVDLIRAGRRNGAKNMEFTVDSKVKNMLGLSVDGIPLQFGRKFGNKINVKVVYK